MESIKILSVTGSVNKESLSVKLNNAVVSKLLMQYPNSLLTRLDTSHSEFANLSLNEVSFASFFNDANSDYWIEKLHESDILVLSTPMVNFTYAAGIKNFIDAIAVANKTFSYKYSKKGGSVGLLNKLKVILIGTQGAPIGWYPFAAFIDNLEGIFNFLGAKQIEKIVVDANKVEPRSALKHEQIIDSLDQQLDAIVQKMQ
ncbi:FMN-dependent NADH-azoreductase [Mycoplasmopsis mucosicanis]|uniref:FMN-dependent NADH-azoreductase n=1 Tax=Mycoplasmopsis mucosicanis TaxID=458208 RepID=A0A507SPS4_9BACT|nr:FMN-dependent NADH-azoreductase [Mycoplasmopsis mucosicanis]TQC51362.1 FMN-dependent NADH-azoreductase [Mycoplasmopsis mucosicanis]